METHMHERERLVDLPAGEPLPPALRNVFFFACFNALSFQIVLGSPMVLYAKTLDASATVLGIVAGMMPLLVIFQIPAASYVDRVGYKRFVFAGWGIRVGFIFVMALVPLTAGFLSASARLALMLLLLFSFNLSRGISSCAWLPWITSMVPAARRGGYLVREAAFVNTGSFVTLTVAGLSLGHSPAHWQFALIFTFSGVMGAISLKFLKQIPDVPIPPRARASTTAVPYWDMVNYRPFRKLLILATIWSLAYGGMTTFTVAFLKAETALAEGQILFVAAVAFLGGLSSLWFLGSRMDRLGSKPIVLFSLSAWLAIVAGWACLAGRFVATDLSLVILLQFLMGLAAALVNMANTRLAMAIIPGVGRNHFFAIYSVVANVVLGVAPILWGLLIDVLQKTEFQWGRFTWNKFSLFFATTALVFLAAIAAARRIEEPHAASMETLLRELLIESPQRVWIRLWPRI